MDSSESELVEAHLPCGKCGSADAAAYYDDGHWHCFSCGKTWNDETAYQGKGRTSKVTETADLSRPSTVGIRSIISRGLTQDTCKRWGYYYDDDGGAQWATYCNANGSRCAYKIRHTDSETGEKSFRWKGKLDKKAPLFGQQLWSNSGAKIVVITEGEIDAMSVSQAQAHKWPVVSIPNGAQSAAKEIARALPWLQGFEKVVLMFDNDKPGREAAQEAALKLPPGKAFIAKLPSDVKDANELLLAGRGRDITNAIHGAQRFLPGGIMDATDLLDTMDIEPTITMPWADERLTEWTFGRRYGEVYTWGGGSGSGKTDKLYEEMAHLIKIGEDVGIFSWESGPATTLRHIIGKMIGKRLHIPDPDNILWTKDDIAAGKQAYTDSGATLWVNDAYGQADWDEVSERIRYLANAHGVKHFVLDPMTAMTANMEDERRGIDKVMAGIGQLAEELKVCMYVVCHLASPGMGKSHEEGARVKASHLRGSRTIIAWSYFIFGIERNQQDPGSATILRCLKDRFTGNALGQTMAYTYNVISGRTEPCKVPDYGQPKEGDADDRPPYKE